MLKNDIKYRIIRSSIKKEITHYKLGIINNSMNEVLELFDNDTEFIIKIGVSKINLLYKNN